MRSANSPARLHIHAGAASNKPDLGKLVHLLSAYAPHDGSFDLRIPRVHARRF